MLQFSLGGNRRKALVNVGEATDDAHPVGAAAFSCRSRTIALDLGAQSHNNPDIQYLTKNSIVFNGSNNPPTITGYRSPANYITYRIGMTVGIR